VSSFKAVGEKIRHLENERRNLMLEIDELKKMADSKAKALESEVGMLRDEVRSLRMILGASEADEESDPKKRPHRP
jgi:regulator of replication initiation timing